MDIAFVVPADAKPAVMNPANVSYHPDEFQVFPYRRFCHNSDGSNFCQCQMKPCSREIEDCEYYGRSTEPLAFSLSPNSALAQDQCPLFAVFPKEVRDMIYEFAFTDDTSNPPNRNQGFRNFGERSTSQLYRSDIAFAFLQTCKAVYLEAYRLPLLLNPLNVYNFYGPIQPRLDNLAPWQFALIQSIDVSLHQRELNTGMLDTYLELWKDPSHSEDAYVVPRFYNRNLGIDGFDSNTWVRKFHFGLLQSKQAPGVSPQDGDELRLPAPRLLDFYDHIRSGSEFNFTGRAMLARPLTRLTLRLTRKDWYYWTSHPEKCEVFEQLHLDPSFELDESRGLAQMQEQAEQRRAGNHPAYEKSWGAVVCAFPHLKTLELVLETWEVKKRQLEAVVDCAQLWKFPLTGTRAELVWKHTENRNWKRKPGDEGDFMAKPVHSDEWDGLSNITDDEDLEKGWNDLCTAYEVRVVRYQREIVSPPASVED